MASGHDEHEGLTGGAGGKSRAARGTDVRARVVAVPAASAPPPATQPASAPPARSLADGALAGTQRRLRELSFLHEFLQLATTARTWDQLMRTIVDRTTEALDVDASSFYLLDRDGTGVTLAATNGLDRSQVGVARLPLGEGLTGRAAVERQPIISPDVRQDPRFKWIPGLDQARFTSWLSAPLLWDDRIVGVLNVQTIERHDFTRQETESLITIAALLAGIVEKGRLQAEQADQLRALTALDSARAELLSLVTHELRTPLAVVRAYLDLLADSAVSGRPSQEAESWHSAAVEQVGRLDRLVDSILASVRGDGLQALARVPFDVPAAVDETVAEMAPLLRAHPLRWSGGHGHAAARGDSARFRQVLEHLLDNEAKYAPAGGGVSLGTWRDGGEVRVYITDDGPGVPSEEWDSVFDAYVRLGGRGQGSGIGLYAARRLMEAMGGHAWLEPNGYGGSRFVLALPAAD